MTTIQVSELRGRPVALALRQDAVIADHVTGEDRGIVAAMALYALEIQSGRRPGPYTDDAAERYARRAIELRRDAPRIRRRGSHPRPTGPSRASSSPARVRVAHRAQALDVRRVRLPDRALPALPRSTSTRRTPTPAPAVPASPTPRLPGSRSSPTRSPRRSSTCPTGCLPGSTARRVADRRRVLRRPDARRARDLQDDPAAAAPGPRRRAAACLTAMAEQLSLMLEASPAIAVAVTRDVLLYGARARSVRPTRAVVQVPCVSASTLKRMLALAEDALRYNQAASAAIDLTNTRGAGTNGPIGRGNLHANSRGIEDRHTKERATWPQLLRAYAPNVKPNPASHRPSTSPRPTTACTPTPTPTARRPTCRRRCSPRSTRRSSPSRATPTPSTSPADPSPRGRAQSRSRPTRGPNRSGFRPQLCTIQRYALVAVPSWARPGEDAGAPCPQMHAYENPTIAGRAILRRPTTPMSHATAAANATATTSPAVPPPCRISAGGSCGSEVGRVTLA
jgi:hypothetical protein